MVIWISISVSYYVLCKNDLGGRAVILFSEPILIWCKIPKDFFISRQEIFFSPEREICDMINCFITIYLVTFSLSGEKNAPDIFLPIKMGFYTKIGIKDLPAKSSGHKTHQFPETENHMSIKLYTTSVSFYELS